MRFFNIALTLLSAAAGYVSAQVVGGPNPIIYPSAGDVVPAGTNVIVRWSPSNTATITLTLRYGNMANLDNGGTVAVNIPNSGSYSWAVPKNIGSGVWSLEIKDANGGVNYSPMFQVTGGTGTQGPTGSATTRDASTTSTATTTTTGTTTTKTSSSTSASSSSGSSSSSSRSSSSSSSGTTSSAVRAPSAGAALKVGAGGGFAAAIGFGALVALA